MKPTPVVEVTEALKLGLNRPMEPDDTFQVTLLCLLETACDILTQRAGNLDDRKIKEKRLYWMDKVRKAIEGLHQSYMGYLPEDFIERSMRFNKMVEIDLNFLLKGYHDKYVKEVKQAGRES